MRLGLVYDIRYMTGETMNHTTRLSSLSLVLGVKLLLVGAAITTAQTQLDGPGSGLVGWWRFEETSGTIAYDSGGNGHNGTLIDSPTRVAGRIGTGALSFDGISTLVEIPSSTDFDFPGDFSVSAWVYSETNSRVTAVGRATSNLWNLWVLEQVTSVRFDMEYVDRIVYGEASHRGIGSGLGYTTNAWHHVCGVKSNDVIRIYVDAAAGTTSAAITNSIALGTSAISIGSRRAATPDACWKGYIDDVRVYNRALSVSEILKLSDGTPPAATGFTIPAIASSLVVPIATFTATDNVGVTGYLVTESSAAPSATDPGWTNTALVSYTFSSAGSKTLYAWARDAAGNVSASLSATVLVSMNAVRPEFRDVHVAGGKLIATFDAIAGKNYVLEQSTNLAAWSDLQTNGPVSSSGSFSVEVAITTAGFRFFRLRQEP
jgi:hypothetical protein